MTVVGLVTLALGLVMVVAPETSFAIWPWVWEIVPGPPQDVDGLTHRLIAVMFVGLATGAAFTIWQNRRDVAEVFLAMLAAYAIGGALGVLLFVAESLQRSTCGSTWVCLPLLACAPS